MEMKPYCVLQLAVNVASAPAGALGTASTRAAVRATITHFRPPRRAVLAADCEVWVAVMVLIVFSLGLGFRLQDEPRPQALKGHLIREPVAQCRWTGAPAAPLVLGSVTAATPATTRASRAATAK